MSEANIKPETLDALRKIGWQPIKDGDVLPEWVHNVVLARSNECHARKAETNVEFLALRKFPVGWYPMTGWELWFPLP